VATGSTNSESRFLDMVCLLLTVIQPHA